MPFLITHELAASKPAGMSAAEREGLQILDDLIDDFTVGAATREELLEALGHMADIIRKQFN